MEDFVTAVRIMDVIRPIDCREEPLSDDLDSVRIAEFQQDDFDLSVELAAGVEFGACDGIEGCEFRSEALQPAALWLFNPARESAKPVAFIADRIEPSGGRAGP